MCDGTKTEKCLFCSVYIAPIKLEPPFPRSPCQTGPTIAEQLYNIQNGLSSLPKSRPGYIPPVL
jgi:hypothetical protein